MTDLLAPALDARSFSYDSADRLIQSATAVVGPTNSYTLDGVGNWLNVAGGTNAGSYVMNPASPPADFQMNQYTTTPFDSRTYDLNGNLTNAGLQRFVYDCWNRLVSYTNSTSGVAVAFKYDCFGRRIEKSGAATTNRYYYTGWQEIEEQNRTNATVATYVWGTYIDELLTTDRGGQRYFFHADDLGSIRKVTDSSGNVVEQYRYADYGLPTFLNGAGTPLAGTQIGNSTLFNGRRYDLETGLYYYRTRYLDPSAGRFTTRDTIGIWGDPGNLGNGYTYVGNSPMDDTDPDGDTSKSVNTSRSNVKDNRVSQGPPPPGGGPGTGPPYRGTGIGGILPAEGINDPIGGVGVGLGKKPNPGAQIAQGHNELPGTGPIYLGDPILPTTAKTVNPSRSNVKDNLAFQGTSSGGAGQGPSGRSNVKDNLAFQGTSSGDGTGTGPIYPADPIAGQAVQQERMTVPGSNRCVCSKGISGS
jgi:RHS repeat-associated protein